MRIAFLVHDRANYGAGPLVNARRLLPALAQRGHEPVAIVLHKDKGAPNAEALRAQGIRCIVQLRPQFTEDSILQICSILRDLDPDVFVPNLYVAGWFAARWVREAGIPTIATHRSDDPFYGAMVEQFVLGPPEWAVSGLVCVSHMLYERVASAHPPHTRLTTIPSGVPMPVRNHAHLGPPLKLVYLGRLVKRQKRIDRVIAAMGHVLEHDSTAQADIWGDGPDRNEVMAQAESFQLGNRLQVHGLAQPEALDRALNGATAMLLLSDYEGMPGALMDGMAHGLVPICTDFAGVRELVRDGENGLIVDGSPASVLEAARRLQSDPARFAQMSEAARETIQAAYSLDITTQCWIDFCELLCREAPPRRPWSLPQISQLNLPPVQPALAREDKRRTDWLGRGKRMIGGLFYNARRRFRGRI